MSRPLGSLATVSKAPRSAAVAFIWLKVSATLWLARARAFAASLPEAISSPRKSVGTLYAVPARMPTRLPSTRTSSGFTMILALASRRGISVRAVSALTLIPRLDASAKIMVKPEDVRVEGSRIGILAGTAYSVPTLFRGLLMASGNDAANALARANQSVAVTLSQMDATAADLGAFDTVAKDPSGLDMPGQTSSAYDLALIGRAAMKLPDFRGYVSTKSATVPGGRSNDGKTVPAFRINNHNTLLYNYPGAIGVKNGYTIAARQTFIAAATRSGKTYIVTEMGSPNGSWRPTAALLDWAFAHGAQVAPIGELVEPGSVTRPGLTSTSGAGSSEGATPAGPGAADLGRPTLLRLPALQPWIGAAGLLSGMVLVGALAARSIAGRRS